jgi:uncharacterized protein (TIGR02453 family)
MGFTGFSDEAFEFYEGLLADNSKTYWTRHKATYERAVRAPMAELFAELEPEFGAARLFRPYRDVRFARDKSPYKTQQGGVAGGYYFQLDADGLMVAGGMWAPEPEQLARFRAAVDADASGKALVTIVDDLRAAGYEIGGDLLKTRPRGTPPDHPRIELLRHRSLYAHRGWPPEDWVFTPQVIDRVRTAWRGLRPLIDWTRDHT